MSNSPGFRHVTINRSLIGAIAIALLLLACCQWFFVGSQNIWTGASVKVALVMIALWLALPTITKRGDWGQASWVTVVGLVGLALVLTGKRVDTRIAIPILIGAAIATLILRPRSKIRSK